jgi:hypothetical protein
MTRKYRLYGILAAMLFALFAGNVLAGHAILEPTGSLPLKADAQSPTNGFAVTFDLSSIPEGARIDLAELNVTVTSDTALGRHVSVLVYAGRSNWTPSALASTAEISTTDSLMMSNFVATGEDRHLEVNVTELVRLWCLGQLDNNGFVLLLRNNADHLFAAAQSGAEVDATLKVFFSNVR